MKKRADFSRVKKYPFYQILQKNIKAYIMRGLKNFIIAIVFLSITALCVCSIVSTEYMWIVWVGAAVLLVMFHLFAMLWLPAYDIIKYRYIPHKKVLLRLNCLTDVGLADIEKAVDKFQTVDLCIYTNELFVGPRIFVYYKDIVSIEHRSKRVLELQYKPKLRIHKPYEHYLIVTDTNNEKWYVSAIYDSNVYHLNQVYEELLIRCDSNVKIIGDFAYKASLVEDSENIRTTAKKIIDVIYNRDQAELYDMFFRHIKKNEFNRGVEYVFSLFNGRIVSVNDCRSYAKPWILDDENSKIGLGRYNIVTEDNEYYLFFVYSIKGGLDQGKLIKLKLAPKGSMTEKEFFINDAGILNKTGIYHPGWDEEMN